MTYLWVESQKLSRHKVLLAVRAVADETASLDNSRAITESPQSEPPGSESTHLCMITHADNKWRARAEPQPPRRTAAPREPSKAKGLAAAATASGPGTNKEVTLTCQ